MVEDFYSWEIRHIYEKMCMRQEALLLGKEENLARHKKAQWNIGITIH